MIKSVIGRRTKLWIYLFGLRKRSFRVIGYMIQTTNKKGEERKAVPSTLGQVFKAEGLEKPLLELTEQEPQGLFWH